MAASKATLREDLTCSICYELFREPVMLACMHHFCKHCISTYWSSIRGPVSCPQCRKEFTNRQFQTNYLVAGLVEKVRATSSDGHIKRIEKNLKERLDSYTSQKKQIIGQIHKEEKQMDTIRKVGDNLRERVRRDFQALHTFLQTEEASMLEQLRRDQEELEQVVERRLQSLTAAARELEQNLKTLQELDSFSTHGVLVELPELNSRPQLPTLNGLDIDGFTSKYITPLQYTVWRKMYRYLKPGPLPLTFDEDTVHPSLQLSQDKTEVIEHNLSVLHKPNPKRFVQCVNVLAAQGFHTGRHYWEVGVGTKPKWDLGVALETVDRQARVKLCPDNGYWTLRLRNRNKYSAGTQPWTGLNVTSRPSRIGVFVDCEERRVSFYDADGMRPLYSFTNGPRGKMFPFFSTCLSEPGQQAQAIRLLHFPSQAL